MKKLLSLLLTLLLAAAACTAALADTSPFAHAHEWREVSRTAPTCTAKGSVTYACSCGESRVEQLSATGHRYGSWKTTAQATCSEKGSRERRCQVCGHVDRESVARLPHTWGEWEIVTEATDHSSGVRRHTCEVCGEAAEESYDPEGTLRRGARGAEVVRLQEGLICRGALAAGGADGSFGPGTEAAVKAVQEAAGLAVDGVAWPQTRALADHAFGGGHTEQVLTRRADGVRARTCMRCGFVEREVIEARPVLRRGDRGDRVVILQEILGEIGYDPGKPDGIFGPQTGQAVENWARDHDWYYKPGLARPVDIDGIVTDWIRRQPGDRIGVSGEDTPVSIQFTLTPAFATDINYIGERMDFNWVAVNLGSEDCTLGPILVDYGNGDRETRFRYVGDLSGSLLKAEGGNALSGTLTIAIEKHRVDWEGDFGTLTVNARALGTSRETGKKWYSNTEVETIDVVDVPRAIEPKLKLTGGLVDRQDAYDPDGALAFDFEVANGTGMDLTEVYIEICRVDGMGEYTMEIAGTDALASGAAWEKALEHALTPGELAGGGDVVNFYIEAAGRTPQGDWIFSERIHDSVHIHWEGDAPSGGLVLTVEQVSPAQATYAAGDEISLAWTLTWLDEPDATLDFIGIQWGDPDAIQPVCDDPLRLYANGANTLSDTWTEPIPKDWILNGGINLTIFARVMVDGEEQLEYYRVSNEIPLQLPIA